MKFLILFCFVALTQADLSKFGPDEVLVKPRELSEFAPRLVGGANASATQFFYQVALIGEDGTFCSGSILHGLKNIVTAASCVYGLKTIKVVAGELKVHQAKGVIATFTIHEEFDPYYRTNDIALVHLREKLKASDSINWIGLYSTTGITEKTGKVSGWGRYSDSSNALSPVLRYADQKIISNVNCRKFFSKDVIKNSNVCVGGETGTSVCTGDIGSPLTVPERGFHVTLAGIASFVSPWGCSIGYPAVYTRVSSYADWIKNNLVK